MSTTVKLPVKVFVPTGGFVPGKGGVNTQVAIGLLKGSTVQYTKKSKDNLINVFKPDSLKSFGKGTAQSVKRVVWKTTGSWNSTISKMMEPTVERNSKNTEVLQEPTVG